jgi:hypothetical protein
MQQAAALLKLNETRGMEYSPAKDGFPFSNHLIHGIIERRLERAARQFQTQSLDGSPHEFERVLSVCIRFHPSQLPLVLRFSFACDLMSLRKG